MVMTLTSSSEFQSWWGRQGQGVRSSLAVRNSFFSSSGSLGGADGCRQLLVRTALLAAAAFAFSDPGPLPLSFSALPARLWPAFLLLGPFRWRLVRCSSATPGPATLRRTLASLEMSLTMSSVSALSACGRLSVMVRMLPRASERTWVEQRQRRRARGGEDGSQAWEKWRARRRKARGRGGKGRKGKGDEEERAARFRVRVEIQ